MQRRGSDEARVRRRRYRRAVGVQTNCWGTDELRADKETKNFESKDCKSTDSHGNSKQESKDTEEADDNQPMTSRREREDELTRRSTTRTDRGTEGLGRNDRPGWFEPLDSTCVAQRKFDGR